MVSTEMLGLGLVAALAVGEATGATDVLGGGGGDGLADAPYATGAVRQPPAEPTTGSTVPMLSRGPAGTVVVPTPTGAPGAGDPDEPGVVPTAPEPRARRQRRPGGSPGRDRPGGRREHPFDIQDVAFTSPLGTAAATGAEALQEGGSTLGDIGGFVSDNPYATGGAAAGLAAAPFTGGASVPVGLAAGGGAAEVGADVVTGRYGDPQTVTEETVTNVQGAADTVTPDIQPPEIPEPPAVPTTPPWLVGGGP